MKRQSTLSANSAIGVIYCSAGKPSVLGKDQTFGLIDHLGHRQFKRSAGQQLACTVIQALPAEIDALLAGDFPAAIVGAACLEFQHFCRGEQTAVLVIHGGSVETQITLRDQLTALLIQHTNRGVQIILAGDAPFGVFNGIEGQAYRANRAGQAVLVVQGLAVECQRLLAVKHTFTVVELADVQVQPLIGAHRAATVIQAIAAQGQQVLSGQATGAVVHTPSLDVHHAFGEHGTFGLVIEQAVDFHRQAAISRQTAGLAVIQAGRGHVQTLAGAQGAGLVEQCTAGGQVKADVAHHMTVVAVIQGHRVDHCGAAAGDFAVVVMQVSRQR